MFDVPPTEVTRLEWDVTLPYEDKPWQVGLIVGASGAGKTTIARKLFGDLVDAELTWDKASVIDDFADGLSMREISAVCQAVGFNTVPAWLRPYRVLSNGEQFRVELARRLLEGGDLVVVDEFTSVVDRQVAKIGSHAVQKHVRKGNGKFVGVTCHRDVIDWLQPDWTFDPSTREFAWRSVRPRPKLDIEIRPVPYSTWRVFAPFHYLTASLHRSARCWGLYCNGRLASFAGILYRMHPKTRNLWGCSRLVTLPDFQGLGLAFALIDTVGAIYKADGKRLHTYPAHPALIHAFDRSRVWQLRSKPATWQPLNKKSKASATKNFKRAFKWGDNMGTRPNAVFRYVGKPADKQDSERVMAYWKKK
jgi:ABC-type ATPase involved in cell division